MRISDWSSDVCSSDLGNFSNRQGRSIGSEQCVRPADFVQSREELPLNLQLLEYGLNDETAGGHFLNVTDSSDTPQDRKSVVQGKSVSVRVELGGRSIHK